MKMRVAIFVLLATLSASNGDDFAGRWNVDASPSNVANGTFETRLDHFRPQFMDRITFNYQVNTAHFQPGGPLYIYIKDVRDHTSQWIERGLMVDIAEETNGALFTFNQRYLANNRPTENVTFESMAYLTVEQSLADIATFIRFIRLSPDVYYDTKVILWGSGYGGTVATWARKKYPHLVDGVWSSSGIFNLDLYSYTQYDYLEYIIYSVGGIQCSNLVRQAFFVMDALIREDEGEYLRDALNLCHPVDSDSMLDIASFFEAHFNDIIVFLNRQHAFGLLNFCRDMGAIPGDPFSSFARWLDFTFGSPNCFDHTFTGMVERTSDTEWDTVATDSGRRQWYYSQCTQLGSFVVADEFSWLPGRIPVDYHIQKCEQVLGENYRSELLTSAADALIREFGGFNQTVTNVVYTNGGIDPWLFTGMLTTRDPSTTAIFIDRYSKSADLTSIDRAFDTAILVAAKELIRSNVIAWSSRD